MVTPIDIMRGDVLGELDAAEHLEACEAAQALIDGHADRRTVKALYIALKAAGWTEEELSEVADTAWDCLDWHAEHGSLRS